MLDSAFKWLVYLAAVAGVLYLGWNEPLRYRFMSRAEIDEIEHPKVEVEATPTPVPVKPGKWMWESNSGTGLDRPGQNPPSKSRSGTRPVPYSYAR